MLAAACRRLPHACPSGAGTAEQVMEMTNGLHRLDYYLTNVTNEQR